MFAVSSQCIVLIVEDHSDTSEMLERHLMKKNLPEHQLKAVPDGMSALAFLEKSKPCCMILDETIPGMTGLDLLRQIRAHPEYKDITVFFYSAAYDWRKQMEAEALGAKKWFVKGVSRLADLIDQVVEACAGACGDSAK